MSQFYRNKNVLVAGGTGTIGIPVVKLLMEKGANITVVSMDPPDYARKVLEPEVRFLQKDLTNFENCMKYTKNMDFVFNLVGIKGSVGIGETKVASYFFPMVLYQTYLMEASFRNSVSRYLFTSSICSYPQLDHPKEEDEIWSGIPKQNDRFPGLLKRIGEIQGLAYLLEHKWEAVRIVRPSNVYGPFDDFNPETAQVIPALVARAIKGENPLKVWGDGTVQRDFIYSNDCAFWLTVALEKAPPCVPINIGSGFPVTIREVTETILKHVPNPPPVEWDTEKPSGDPIRILDLNRAIELLEFKSITPFDIGISSLIEWYLESKDLAHLKGTRYYGT